ncbi:hypothetical protein V8G54_012048 [Vigna mungo]|uniref:PB1-like domain-containing protein n=1 Tax=Vigna mungo TaxID=3915 RepID=A0AAQ3NTF9_VIGMU
MEGDIEVVIHHGGKLVNEGCLKYEGECDTMYFEPDYLSYYVVVSVVKALGYVGFQDLWYSVGCGPVLDGKLEALSDDVRAMHMVNLARLNGRVHLYVAHSVSQPDVIEMIEYNVHEEVEEVLTEMHDGGESAKLDERTEEHDGGVTTQFGDGTKQLDEGVRGDVGEGDRIQVDVVEGEEIQVDVGEGEGIQHDEADNEDIIEVDVHGEEIQVDVGEGEGIQNDEGHDEETIEGPEATQVDVEGEGIHVEGHSDAGNDANITVVNEWSSSDDDIGEVNIMDDEMHSVDGLVDVNIQCDFRERDSSANMEVDCSVLFESDLEQHESDLEEHDIKSEELTSPYMSDEESDVEEGYGNFVTFTMPKKMVDFKWEKVDILDAIKTYGLENGKKLKFIKNDKRRIRIKCMGGKGECPWIAYFGYMEAIDTWQLRTMVDGHT